MGIEWYVIIGGVFIAMGLAIMLYFIATGVIDIVRWLTKGDKR